MFAIGSALTYLRLFRECPEGMCHTSGAPGGQGPGPAGVRTYVISLHVTQFFQALPLYRPCLACPSPALVLQATNAEVRPGYEATTGGADCKTHGIRTCIKDGSVHSFSWRSCLLGAVASSRTGDVPKHSWPALVRLPTSRWCH